MSLVFANCSKEDAIYPLITQEIAEAQQQDNNLTKQAEKEGYSTQLVKNIEVLCYKGKMVIPKSLQHRAVAWFYHYLQHPGTECLEEILRLSMDWKCLRMTVQSHIKKCHSCQVNKWQTANKTCNHQSLGDIMCGSHRTIHPHRQEQDTN